MTLARCAHCLRSGTMGLDGSLLYCAHCRLSFCRGACHADFPAGRWEDRPIAVAIAATLQVAALPIHPDHKVGGPCSNCHPQLGPCTEHGGTWEADFGSVPPSVGGDDSFCFLPVDGLANE